VCTIACEPVDGAEEAGRIGAVTATAQGLVGRAFCVSASPPFGATLRESPAGAGGGPCPL